MLRARTRVLRPTAVATRHFTAMVARSAKDAAAAGSTTSELREFESVSPPPLQPAPASIPASASASASASTSAPACAQPPPLPPPLPPPPPPNPPPAPPQVSQLPQQDPDATVEVEVAYSDLNYKDGLIVLGRSGVVKAFPIVPGIDFAGTVVRSRSPHFQEGDAVAHQSDLLHGPSWS